MDCVEKDLWAEYFEVRRHDLLRGDRWEDNYYSRAKLFFESDELDQVCQHFGWDPDRIFEKIKQQWLQTPHGKREFQRRR